MRRMIAAGSGSGVSALVLVRRLPFARRGIATVSRVLAARPEENLAREGITLGSPAAAKGNYVSAVRTGNLLFLSGHLPFEKDSKMITGKVGKDLTLDAGYHAAKLCGIGLLTTLKAELGDLDRVARVVKVTGMVNCEGGFTDQPKVINGCSDLLVKVFEERGKHTRVAAGFVSLPLGAAVEIDMVVEVK